MSGSGAGAASVNQSERRIDALESTGPRRIVYPPDHGRNVPRSPDKRKCRVCHAPAGRNIGVKARMATRLRLDGTRDQFLERVSTYYCDKHFETW